MTLDEFQTQWTQQDQKLDTVIRLNKKMLSSNSLDGARTSLRRQIAVAVFSAVTSWIVIPLMGLFIAKYFAEPKFVLAALAIGMFFIVTMVSHIRQAKTLASIDYAEPVAVIQKQIDTVVRMRIRLAQGIAMAMVLLWVPIAIIGARIMLGIDLYEAAPAWLIANVLFGFSWMAFIAWLAKRNASRSQTPPAQWLLREITGGNLNSAKQFLASLAEFEEERGAK